MTTDEIRALIRKTRKARHMTAAQVASAMGISRPFYTQLEGGTRRLSTDYLLRIADALRVGVTDLLPLEGRAGAVPDRAELTRRLLPVVGERADQAAQVVVDYLAEQYRTPA